MTVRFAVVGCGAAAHRIHLPGLRAAGVEVVAFASRSLASATSARDQWGSGDVVGSWTEVLARDEVDVVLVATPNAQHREITVAALAAGKHVLVDKPMAITVAEADEMVAAARASGRLLVPFHNTRFAPPFVAAAEAVADGRIGDVTGVRAAFGHAGPQAWAPGASWFFDKALAGGGCLLDLGVHVVDVVRSVTGDEVVAVAALLAGPAEGVEVDAQLLVRLGRGAVGSVHASWSSRPGPDHQLTVVGTEGTLHLDSRTPLTLFPGDGGERIRLPVPSSTGSPLEELLAAIAGTRPPSVTAADGRAAVAVVDAAYRSARDGCLTAVG